MSEFNRLSASETANTEPELPRDYGGREEELQNIRKHVRSQAQ